MWWTWNSSGCRPRQEKSLVFLSSDVFRILLFKIITSIVSIWVPPFRHVPSAVLILSHPRGAVPGGPQNHPGEDPSDQGLFVLHFARLGSSVNWWVRAARDMGWGWHSWHFETTFQNKQEMIDFNIDWSYSFNRFRFYHNLSGFHASFRMFWRLRFDLWFGLQADWEEGPVCDFHHREPSKWSCIFSSNHFEPISSMC